MRITTRELGALEVPDEARVCFPGGLLGLEDCRCFVLIDREEFRPFTWLVCEDDPRVAFAVCDPELFRAGAFNVPLSGVDESTLDLSAGDAVSVFIIATIPADGGAVTGNLRAPVVLNTRSRLAKQVIVYGSGVSVRQALLARRPVSLQGALGSPAVAR